MVLLTRTYVEKECSRIQSLKSLTKGIGKNHLRKITHLFMDDKFIDAIGNLSSCENLRVIFLSNNCISRIENLDFAVNLTHLYLQHNNLTKLENLDNLRNLTNLFVGYNSINVVEGMENLEKIRELSIEYQKLPHGESLIFHPKSSETLSVHLRILNVAGNNLSSLKPLNNFRSLQILNARSNAINDIEDLTDTIRRLGSLKEIFLQDNPVTLHYRYRENLIANSISLVNLDDKNISDITRRFLRNLKEKKQQKLARKVTQITLSDDITTSLKLPPAFERSVSRAILQQPGPKLAISVTYAIGEAGKPQIYPPWKSASSIIGKKDSHFTPRPFWNSLSVQRKYRQRDPSKEHKIPAALPTPLPGENDKSTRTINYISL